MVINTTIKMMDLAQAAKDRNIKLVRRQLTSESLVRVQIGNKDDDTQGTALYWMCVHGELDIVKQLLTLGADPNTTNCIKQTPLHAASDMGYTHIVKLLLKHGAKTNSQNDNGYTPLHLAAYRGYEEIVSILLSEGADNSVRNSRGFTPYYEARINRQFTVCNLLLSHQKAYDEPGRISLCKTRSISPTSPSTSSLAVSRITLQKSNRSKSASMDSVLDQANNNVPLEKPVPKPRHKPSTRQHSLPYRQPVPLSLGRQGHSMSFIEPHFGILADKEETTPTQPTDDSLCSGSVSLDNKPLYKS